VGELMFGGAHQLAGGMDPGAAAGVAGCARGKLEVAQLLAGQRRLLVGVVLAAGQHAPEQDRELAGGSDDRLAVPAAGTRALIEGVQRPRLSGHRPRGLDQRPPG
jgi:hypothetical protein